MNTLKQCVYASFTACLLDFLLAIWMTVHVHVFLGVMFTVASMLMLVAFLDVWLEPEKWKQKQ